jgi:dTDP-4-dehydrorhamnose 3,5-epimerase-like enzyme
MIKAALYETCRDSPAHGELEEFLLGQGQPPVVLKIPSGVTNGYRVLS